MFVSKLLNERVHGKNGTRPRELTVVYQILPESQKVDSLNEITLLYCLIIGHLSIYD